MSLSNEDMSSISTWIAQCMSHICSMQYLWTVRLCIYGWADWAPAAASHDLLSHFGGINGSADGSTRSRTAGPRPNGSTGETRRVPF